MHGQINNLVGVSVFPLRGASWTVLPYHMSLDRTNMDSIDRPNFDLLKWFFDGSSDEEKNDKIKSIIEATRANRDVRVWYKQCIPRK